MLIEKNQNPITKLLSIHFHPYKRVNWALRKKSIGAQLIITDNEAWEASNPNINARKP